MEQWISRFIEYSPAYKIFSWLPKDFIEKSDWPTLHDYNTLSAHRRKPLVNTQGNAIQFVTQGAKFPNNLGYEARIFQTGEVQTRPCNWHDFFNMLIWHTFPLIKSLFNCYQHLEISHRNQLNKRSPLENCLTLLDENGLIIVSANHFLLELIKARQWKVLFWEQRFLLQEALSCFVIGHSLHEKLLSPYIGMVGHALLIPVEEVFFLSPHFEQLNIIDEILTTLIEWPKMTTKSLSPFPLLGLPHWHSFSADENFYDNQHYFRPITLTTFRK